MAMVKGTFNKKKALFTSKWNINFSKKLIKWYIWSIALHGVENWTLRKVDQRCLESFENFETSGSHTDCVRNELLHWVKEERNVLHTIKRRKANWNGHILCGDCFLKYIIEGRIGGRVQMSARRGRRRKKLLDDVKKLTGCWKLKHSITLYG